MSLSRCRQNFHEESEGAINRQISMELYASYVYLAMHAYFGRDDVALDEAAEFFLKKSREEREHAEKFSKYLHTRGGRAVFHQIEKPQKQEWGSILEAIEDALNMEKEINASLLKLHLAASDRTDPHFTRFLEEEFLGEQVECIRKLSEYATQLRRVGEGLGVFMFSKDLH